MVPSPVKDQRVGEPDWSTASRTPPLNTYMWVASKDGIPVPPNAPFGTPVADERIRAEAYLPPSRYRCPPLSTEVVPPPPLQPKPSVHLFVPSRPKP